MADHGHQPGFKNHCLITVRMTSDETMIWWDKKWDYFIGHELLPLSYSLGRSWPPVSVFKGLRRLINVNVCFFEGNKLQTFDNALQSTTLFSHTFSQTPPCLSSWLLEPAFLRAPTLLFPAWPIIWYLTTQLQDTCSLELKCHWGILSVCRQLWLTSDFTLLCYKAGNTRGQCHHSCRNCQAGHDKIWEALTEIQQHKKYIDLELINLIW